MNFEQLILGVSAVSGEEKDPGAGYGPMPQKHWRGVWGLAGNAREQKEPVCTTQQAGEKHREVNGSYIVEKRRGEEDNHAARAVQGNHSHHDAGNEPTG